MTWLFQGVWWAPGWRPPLAVIPPTPERAAQLARARAKRAASNKRAYQKRREALKAVKEPDSLAP